MERVGSEEISDLNEVLQLATPLWNYSLGIEPRGKKEEQRTVLVDSFQEVLKMDQQQAEDFLSEMLTRKEYLFPPEIQPAFPPATFFIRKEVSHLIVPFNFYELQLSEQPIPPDTEDQKMIQTVRQMDRYLLESADYDEWEDHYFQMEEECASRFRTWLFAKGLTEEHPDFAYCIEIFLNFVYRYGHNSVVILANVSSLEIEEFFRYHLLRKVIVEPHEYTWWIPALKLFYTFLYEKGYLSEESPLIEHLDEVEPHFIEQLRENFS